MQRIPALVIGDSTLGSLGESDCASSGIRPFRMNLGSVVQALSCDSQSTLLDDDLLFFLEEGCQPPPQMLHILKGLPNL